MRRSLLNITLSHVFFLILKCSTVGATIIPRYKQTAVYDSGQDRAVFVGGTTAVANNTKDVFSLDLSGAFNRTAANFTILPNLGSAVSDAALVIDQSGMVHVLGGQQDTCTSSILYQTLDNNASAWSAPELSGTVPSPRSGARATLLDGEILFFGGKSLPNCSSAQYYYNTLYHIDPLSSNSTALTGTNSPVAEADMTMTRLDDGSFMLIGGEAVSSTSKASWVGMSQYAVYDSNTTSWSYLSLAGGAATPAARSGHSAVSNGTHTFVYGGSLGNISSSPTFLSIDSTGSSVDIIDISASNDTAAPPSLFGHSAVMTENSIMIIAFGLIGTSSSNNFNTAIYMYDTVSGKWLDRYDPDLNKGVQKSHGLSKALIAVVAVVSALIVGTVICLVMLFLKRKKAHKRNRSSYPVNRLGILTPETENGTFEKREPMEAGTLEVHLPPWAAMHACHARSKSPPPKTTRPQNSSIAQIFASNDQIPDYDVQDVQFACPPSPRVLTFTAPKLLLRVVNPETNARSAYTDDTRGYPELFETTSCGITTSVPISITNEDDLELLRTKLSEEPMTGDINNQLAGLGLVLQDTLVKVTGSNTLQRISTISRTAAKTKDVGTPRLSLDIIGSSSLLDSVLPGRLNSTVGRSDTHRSSMQATSYSPYFDSPHSDQSSQCSTSPHRFQAENESIIQRPALARRRSSWSSQSSEVSLIQWTGSRASRVS